MKKIYYIFLFCIIILNACDMSDSTPAWYVGTWRGSSNNSDLLLTYQLSNDRFELLVKRKDGGELPINVVSKSSGSLTFSSQLVSFKTTQEDGLDLLEEEYYVSTYLWSRNDEVIILKDPNKTESDIMLHRISK